MLRSHGKAEPGHGFKPDDIGGNKRICTDVVFSSNRQKGRDDGNCRVSAHAAMHIVIVEYMRCMTIDECCRERVGCAATSNQRDIAAGPQNLRDKKRAAIIRSAKRTGKKINNCRAGNSDCFWRRLRADNSLA
ncbi:hypothetical protein D9M69_653710 [compost metagenome]